MLIVFLTFYLGPDLMGFIRIQTDSSSFFKVPRIISIDFIFYEILILTRYVLFVLSNLCEGRPVNWFLG